MSEEPADETEAAGSESRSDEIDPDAEGSSEGRPAESRPDPDADAPLADLARRVSDRRRASDSESAAQSGTPPDVESVEREEPPAEGDDPFRRMSVAEIDEETLWSSLEADAEPTVAVGSPESAESADVGTPGEEGAEAASEPNEHVVSKTEYCQKCPYLQDPPELACTHEGTEIVAVEDADHFRVRNCPMIDE